MANETSALRSQPLSGRVVEHDYQSFCDAVGASARGRAFLQEYARRNRHADTEVVLAALARLESVARSQKTAPEAERIRQDLRALLGTIHSARPQIDSTPGAIKSATLAALIEFVQARIEALVSPMNMSLTPVPEPEQRELPIPQPGSTAQRTIALVEPIASQPTLSPRVPAHARNFDPDVPSLDAPRTPKIIPEVNFIDSLFDEIDAKAKAQKKAALIASSPPAAAGETSTALPLAAIVPAVAAAPSAILASVDMPGPVAATTSEAGAGATALLADEPAIIGQTLALTETTDDADTVGTTDSFARASSATAAAIDASAAAIDEIVAAAEAAMAEEAARAQAPRSEPAFVEIPPVGAFVVEAPPGVSTPEPVATLAEAVVAAVAAEPVTTAVADAVSTPTSTATAESSTPIVDNALSAIMALSEEERLALFT